MRISVTLGLSMLVLVGLLSVFAVPNMATLWPGADPDPTWGYRAPFSTTNGYFFFDADGPAIQVNPSTGAYYSVPWHGTSDYIADPDWMLDYDCTEGSSNRLHINHADQAAGWSNVQTYIYVSVPANATNWYKLWVQVTAGYYDMGDGGWGEEDDEAYFTIISSRYGAMSAWPYYCSGSIRGGTTDPSGWYGRDNGTAGYDSMLPEMYENSNLWGGWINNSPETGYAWNRDDFTGSFTFQFGLELDDTHHHAASSDFLIYAVHLALVPTDTPWQVADLGVGVATLRPDEDIDPSPNFDTFPLSQEQANMLDETTYMSDNYTTSMSTSVGGISMFSMTDPDISLGEDSLFNLTLWVIARSDGGYAYERNMIVALASHNFEVVGEQEATLSNVYANYSFQFPVNPSTGALWTYSEIVDLTLFLGGNMTNFTQAAVIIYVEDYEAPGEEETPGEQWSFDIVSSGGIIGILGLLGFFGMIATPAISYLQYKNGEEPFLAGVHGIWLMALFFGLFLTSIMINA